MTKFRPSKKNSKNSPEESRLSFEEYQQNQENYRKNVSGRSNDSMGQAEDDLDEGRLFYSDVYIIGKKEKINLSGQVGVPAKKRQKVRECEDDLKTPRLFSSREFLERYQKVRDLLGPEQTESDRADRTKNVESSGKRSKTRPSKSDDSKAASEKTRKNRNVGSEPGDRGKAVGLRIIGGKYRGTKLEYGGDRRVRPMKDRVREAVFNLVGTDVQGKHILDLFAGTGALSLEALSRGAKSATMIEVHFPTARIAKRNIDLVGERDSAIPPLVNVVTTDVFYWGRNLEKSTGVDPEAFPESFAYLPTDVPWLVFCSPPYDFYVTRQNELLELLQTLRKVAPKDSSFVVESDDRFDFDLLNAPISPRKRKSYPPAEVAVFAKE